MYAASGFERSMCSSGGIGGTGGATGEGRVSSASPKNVLEPAERADREGALWSRQMAESLVDASSE